MAILPVIEAIALLGSFNVGVTVMLNVDTIVGVRLLFRLLLLLFYQI